MIKKEQESYRASFVRQLTSLNNESTFQKVLNEKDLSSIHFDKVSYTTKSGDVFRTYPSENDPTVSLINKAKNLSDVITDLATKVKEDKTFSVTPFYINFYYSRVNEDITLLRSEVDKNKIVVNLKLFNFYISSNDTVIELSDNFLYLMSEFMTTIIESYSNRFLFQEDSKEFNVNFKNLANNQKLLLDFYEDNQIKREIKEIFSNQKIFDNKSTSEIKRLNSLILEVIKENE
ncbi:MAG: hypothetical protein HXM94_01140 [Parvimonas micra]|uniref:Uncharacterized protein n=1 Tax=Parvimonas micra TaxID=33033 RepID=A0A930H328_9FIRM|nr:hypothetical protein [Parvimonas micra]MBF1306381.1 hypothetical protein [Parvimonas micra]